MTEARAGMESLDRYARQMVIPEIGREGQLKLLKSSVLLITSPGVLSSLVLAPFRAAGFSRLTVVLGDPCSAMSGADPALGENPDCRVEFTASLPAFIPDAVLLAGMVEDCLTNLNRLSGLGIDSPMVVATRGPGPQESMLCGAGLERKKLHACLDSCSDGVQAPMEAALFATAGEIVKAVLTNPVFPPCGAVVIPDNLGPTRPFEPAD